MIELTDGKDYEQSTYFVEVILPLSLQGTYTYRIPQEWNAFIEKGKRVIVQFGKNRIYSALIYSISNMPPSHYEAKYIIEVLDDEPIVTPKQFQLWEWMSSYYLCTLGEVMQAALPSAFKLASETYISKVEDIEVDLSILTEKEYLIWEALELLENCKINDLIKLLGQKSIFPILKSLLDKGVIQIHEQVVEKLKPKTQNWIKLSDEYLHDKENLHKLLDSLNRAPKQQDLLLYFLSLQMQNKDSLNFQVEKKQLLQDSGISNAVLNQLIHKNVFTSIEKVVSRIDGYDVEILSNFALNEAQNQALDEIQEQFKEKDVVLLHGVTSSGKTQIYIRLIEKLLEKNSTQILFLLPEIALTTQMTVRLKLHFGSKLVVYHSKFNLQERAEIWNSVLNGKVSIVLGARSSIFLPYQNLSLIIVDEEHESSYKQYDPAPRYHARDTAIYLGHLMKSQVLLGSATPSLESYYNTQIKKYGLVNLSSRYGLAQLPEIEIVDVSMKSKQKNESNPYFSETLIQAISDAIEKKEQVILFQNRRGHTPIIQCKTCGFISKCTHCDVSLTYHKSKNKLLCHYCGYHENPIEFCPACGSSHFESKGYGTEKIEEELQLLFPDIRLGRLDVDSAKGKFGFEKVLQSFDEHKIDVLIGTQMVAKGLDFGNVTLIGIINADSLIFFPEFRAYEKAFSLFSQVAGRAGRRDMIGKVLIQTYSPQHRVLEQVIQNDYLSMYHTEIQERQQFNYPPFHRLIHIDVKHSQQEVADLASKDLVALLKNTLHERVLGPEQPLVSRVRNLYIYRIMVKLERNNVDIVKAKDFISNTLRYFTANKKYKGIQLQIDVDPN